MIFPKTSPQTTVPWEIPESDTKEFINNPKRVFTLSSNDNKLETSKEKKYSFLPKLFSLKKSWSDSIEWEKKKLLKSDEKNEIGDYQIRFLFDWTSDKENKRYEQIPFDFLSQEKIGLWKKTQIKFLDNSIKNIKVTDSNKHKKGVLKKDKWYNFIPLFFNIKAFGNDSKGNEFSRKHLIEKYNYDIANIIDPWDNSDGLLWNENDNKTAKQKKLTFSGLAWVFDKNDNKFFNFNLPYYLKQTISLKKSIPFDFDKDPLKVESIKKKQGSSLLINEINTPWDISYNKNKCDKDISSCTFDNQFRETDGKHNYFEGEKEKPTNRKSYTAFTDPVYFNFNQKKKDFGDAYYLQTNNKKFNNKTGALYKKREFIYENEVNFLIFPLKKAWTTSYNSTAFLNYFSSPWKGLQKGDTPKHTALSKNDDFYQEIKKGKNKFKSIIIQHDLFCGTYMVLGNLSFVKINEYYITDYQLL